MPVCFSTFKICGYNEKYNTILYREPILTSEEYVKKYVIFFPGDYSYFFSNSVYTSFKTESTCECTNYCYSYEALFWILSQRYLYDYILFIIPNDFSNYLATFSNFLNPCDIPLDNNIYELNRENENNYDVLNMENKINKKSVSFIKNEYINSNIRAKGIKHLLCLLLSLNNEVLHKDILNEGNFHKIINNENNYNDNNYNNDNNDNGNHNNNNINNNNNNKNYYYICCDKPLINYLGNELKTEKNIYWKERKNNIFMKNIIKNKLVLIGFSKGCSVLFSLLRESHEGPFFWSYVDSIIFLDPGFNKNIYNINIEKNALEKLSQHKLNISVHCTPNQIMDNTSMNIHEEYINFVKILKDIHIYISTYIYYINVDTGLNPLTLHYEILIDYSEEFSNISQEESTPLIVNGVHVTELQYCKREKHLKDFFFDNWKKHSWIIDTML
ncbi:conserved protein, unknown function [Plasmodium reichenowi]|uniref:Uncharacterized protein n=1 Tax=Plasmodium reichenowi TaxID=5854 RepID=A0A151LU72_PLARE|nr:conserved protein, unknown function [Plasmodium reichenowi]KYO02726.1 conserved protein, unknown function [Plasmodium reichenowi]